MVLPGARKFKELGVHSKTELKELESVEQVPRIVIESGDNDEERDDADKTLQ